MDKIKNAYIAVKRLAHPETGEPFKDDEGAFYLVEHDDPCLAKKEFANVIEVAECIADHNHRCLSDKQFAKSNKPFTGEYILLNVITVD